MYRKISDFTDAWTEATASTMRMLDALTDESLTTRVDGPGRTLGKIAWHLVETLGEMLPSAGLKLDFDLANEQVPESAATIASEYARGAKLLGEAVAAQWTDDNLPETTPMYGQTWTLGFTLFCLIVHQAHHRGQMSVLMRQAGLAVPGMVGPSREEWTQMGIPAHE